MADLKKSIVVPWDFSDLAGYALEHAVNLSKGIDGDIVLVHIVKRKSDIEKATEKLEKEVHNQEKKYGIRPLIEIRDGSIFSVIADVISERNAAFAVMGTHGIKGMQKFTGSWALKVIVGSVAPFIVVQARPTTEKVLDNIVFPVDFKFSSKEKLLWAEFVSRVYGSKIHLCYIDTSDLTFKRKILSNITISKKYLSEKNVDYEIIKLQGKSISDEAVGFAKEIGADMIMISTTKNISFQDYVLGASEQKMIANKEKIPVMCVNPSKDTTRTGGLTG